MKKCIVIIFTVLILLSGCSKNNNKDLYISIVSTDIKSDNGMSVAAITYDLKTGEASSVSGVDYTSQYPLSIYDKSDNCLYYSSEVNGGDQLFLLDLNNNKISQLTNDLFAINYIIPGKNKVYLLAVPSGGRSMKPAVYDKLTGEFNIMYIDDGLNYELLTYDVFNDCLYSVAFNQDEDDKALDESDGEHYIPPDYFIYKFNKNFLEQELILKTDNKLITRIAPDPDGNIYYSEADTLEFFEHTNMGWKWNVSDGSITPFIDIDGLDTMKYVKRFLYFYSDKDFLFMGVDKESTKGVFSYNIDTRETKLLFSPEDGFINGFTLLSS